MGDLNGDWDRDRLIQVIFNLVTNAVTHAAAKQVQVAAQGLGPLVELRVTNQGTPIPSELQQSIFDSFVHRETGSPASSSKGLGLGLFIVKEIVTGHQGTVEVSLHRNRGHYLYGQVTAVQFRPESSIDFQRISYSPLRARFAVARDVGPPKSGGRSYDGPATRPRLPARSYGSKLTVKPGMECRPDPIRPKRPPSRRKQICERPTQPDT